MLGTISSGLDFLSQNDLVKTGWRLGFLNGDPRKSEANKSRTKLYGRETKTNAELWHHQFVSLGFCFSCSRQKVGGVASICWRNEHCFDVGDRVAPSCSLVFGLATNLPQMTRNGILLNLGYHQTHHLARHL